MAVLNKAWGSAERISNPDTGVVTGEETTADAEEQVEYVAPRMIYVTDGAVDGFDKVEEVVLMDDKVCIGMWAFDCLKMSSDAVAADPLLADAGEEVPRFIFVSHDLEDVKVVEGSKMSAKNVFKMMEKFAKAAYKVNLKSTAKKVLDILGDFDKLNGQRAILRDKMARYAGDERKIEEAEEEMLEIEQEEKELQEQKDELLKFVLREPK